MPGRNGKYRRQGWHGIVNPDTQVPTHPSPYPLDLVTTLCRPSNTFHNSFAIIYWITIMWLPTWSNYPWLLPFNHLCPVIISRLVPSLFLVLNLPHSEVTQSAHPYKCILNLYIIIVNDIISVFICSGLVLNKYWAAFERLLFYTKPLKIFK